MNERALLSLLEQDMELDVATRFVSLATEYLAATRTGDGAVSSPRTPSQLAARFDEPMPVEGRPLDEILARLRDDVIADANRLYHPRYAGHQVSAPLPVAVWTESL